jgi:hypothetical protein
MCVVHDFDRVECKSSPGKEQKFRGYLGGIKKSYICLDLLHTVFKTHP